MSSEVEREYARRISEMSPAQRMSRCAAMLAWTRQQIARRIQNAQPGIGDEELKWRVALWMYQAEPEMVQMIEQKLTDVSR